MQELVLVIEACNFPACHPPPEPQSSLHLVSHSSQSVTQSNSALISLQLPYRLVRTPCEAFAEINLEICGSVENDNKNKNNSSSSNSNHLSVVEVFSQIHQKSSDPSLRNQQDPSYRGGSHHSLHEHRHQSHASVRIDNPFLLSGPTLDNNNLKAQNLVDRPE